MSQQTRSRKYNITINNPLEHDFSHEQIKDRLSSMKLEYWCMCDEIGAEQTPHTHLFIFSKNAINFSTVQSRFYGAHIECAHGTCQQNRDYIRKEGRYLESDKKETNLIDSFEEFGVMPIERAGSQDNISSQVLQLIKVGCSNLEIIEKYPSFISKMNYIDKVRQEYVSFENRNEFREVEVFYIYGETETGKTRYVLETYGYENVYKITNYDHPFDSYNGENVILFDEFRSSLNLADMLQYLDGYPCKLPARYCDKNALYTKVYIVSNIPIDMQYVKEQPLSPASWQAFRRRVHKILFFDKVDSSVLGYDERNRKIVEVFE